MKANEEAEVQQPTVDTRWVFNALFMVFIGPLSFLALFIASWANAWSKWGWSGVMGNAIVMIIIAILGYRATKVDDEEDDD